MPLAGHVDEISPETRYRRSWTPRECRKSNKSFPARKDFSFKDTYRDIVDVGCTMNTGLPRKGTGKLAERFIANFFVWSALGEICFYSRVTTSQVLFKDSGEEGRLWEKIRGTEKNGRLDKVPLGIQ